MDKRRMPGFSAEDSLYLTLARYATSLSTLLRGTANDVIRPALPNRCECYRSMGGPVCCCNITAGSINITSCCDKFGCY
jgi:hypothetical protein